MCATMLERCTAPAGSRGSQRRDGRRRHARGLGALEIDCQSSQRTARTNSFKSRFPLTRPLLLASALLSFATLFLRLRNDRSAPRLWRRVAQSAEPRPCRNSWQLRFATERMSRIVTPVAKYHSVVVICSSAAEARFVSGKPIRRRRRPLLLR